MKEKTKKILVGTVIGVSVVGIGALGYKYHVLKVENIRLVAENTELKRINSAVIKRSLAKDSFFKEMISDGFRHGSSLAAKHMADLRWLNAA